MEGRRGRDPRGGLWESISEKKKEKKKSGNNWVSEIESDECAAQMPIESRAVLKKKNKALFQNPLWPTVWLRVCNFVSVYMSYEFFTWICKCRQTSHHAWMFSLTGICIWNYALMSPCDSSAFLERFELILEPYLCPQRFGFFHQSLRLKDCVCESRVWVTRGGRGLARSKKHGRWRPYLTNIHAVNNRAVNTD